jgi:hypothetical protein
VRSHGLYTHELQQAETASAAAAAAEEEEEGEQLPMPNHGLVEAGQAEEMQAQHWQRACWHLVLGVPLDPLALALALLCLDTQLAHSQPRHRGSPPDQQQLQPLRSVGHHRQFLPLPSPRMMCISILLAVSHWASHCTLAESRAPPVTGGRLYESLLLDHMPLGSECRRSSCLACGNCELDTGWSP